MFHGCTRCPQELQSQVLALTYQELLTGQNGREVARRIVSAIINLQISRGQSVGLELREVNWREHQLIALRRSMLLARLCSSDVAASAVPTMFICTRYASVS